MVRLVIAVVTSTGRGCARKWGWTVLTWSGSSICAQLCQKTVRPHFFVCKLFNVYLSPCVNRNSFSYTFRAYYNIDIDTMDTLLKYSNWNLPEYGRNRMPIEPRSYIANGRDPTQQSKQERPKPPVHRQKPRRQVEAIAEYIARDSGEYRATY